MSITKFNLSQTDLTVDTYNVFKGRYFPKVDCVDHGDTTEVGSIAYIINEAGGSDRQIDLSPGDYNLTTSLTVPRTVVLKFNNGAVINGTGTLTISGSVEAGLYQIFESTLIVTNMKVDYVYPQWFGAVGDGSHDDTTSIQAAIDCGVLKILFDNGTYKISDTININTGGVFLYGINKGKVYIYQATANKDSFLFAPTTAGTTTDFLNTVSIQGFNITHSATQATSTSGAGIRFLQCNNYKLRDISVNNAPEGITIQGGQFGSLKSFQVFASAGLDLSGSVTGLLYFRQASVGITYQPCYTVEVEDFRLSATALRDTCIVIRNSDGLHFVNGYVAYGKNSLVKVLAERNESYVAATSFVNTYFDCVNSTTNAITIPEDGYSDSHIHTFSIGSGCYLGNGTGIGLYCTKLNTRFLDIHDVSIANFDSFAIYIDGTSSTQIQICGNQFHNIGDALSGGVRIGTAQSFTIVGNMFNTISNVLISLSGTFYNGVISSNTSIDDIPEIGGSPTFTVPLVCVGNVGHNVSTSGFSGLRPGNRELLNTNTLDWYEENTFIPTIALGGASVGITYSTQKGKYTRIGNIMIYNIRINLTDKGSSTGELRISGLPYVAVDTDVTYPAAVRIVNTDSDFGQNHVVADLLQYPALIRILAMETSSSPENTEPMDDTHITNTTNIIISGTYMI